MTSTGWESFLTEMENDLDASEEAVRSGSTSPVPEWEPPSDLGPLPSALEDRAKSLAKRIGVLATFVKYQLSALDADMEHTQRQEQQKGTHNRAVALFLDASV